MGKFVLLDIQFPGGVPEEINISATLKTLKPHRKVPERRPYPLSGRVFSRVTPEIRAPGPEKRRQRRGLERVTFQCSGSRALLPPNTGCR